MDFNPINPQSSIHFFGRIAFIYVYSRAFSAARTFFNINISGPFADFDFEVSLGPLEFFYF
jgi:hypothetical protein